MVFSAICQVFWPQVNWYQRKSFFHSTLIFNVSFFAATRNCLFFCIAGFLSGSDLWHVWKVFVVYSFLISSVIFVWRVVFDPLRLFILLILSLLNSVRILHWKWSKDEYLLLQILQTDLHKAPRTTNLQRLRWIKLLTVNLWKNCCWKRFVSFFVSILCFSLFSK